MNYVKYEIFYSPDLHIMILSVKTDARKLFENAKKVQFTELNSLAIYICTLDHGIHNQCY